MQADAGQLRPSTGAKRPLSPEAVHLPFAAAPYRMAMDLVTVPEPAWFELDERYGHDMAEKQHLLHSRHGTVFAALPGSETARREVLAMVAQALATHHPDWFHRQGPVLHNRLTGEAWDVEAPALDPLDLAGRLVQEDLCLIEPGPEGPTLVAASLCFPSRWHLSEKLGKPLARVHAAVPFYAERLSRPVDRLMRHLKAGHIASRLNWSLPDDPALFQPTGKWRDAVRPDLTPGNVAANVFLRVERQTLRRLPETGAILFGIRVHVYPLHRVGDRLGDLAVAVRALPPEIQHYKSVMPFREVLLQWLDARTAVT